MNHKKETKREGHKEINLPLMYFRQDLLVSFVKPMNSLFQFFQSLRDEFYARQLSPARLTLTRRHHHTSSLSQNSLKVTQGLSYS